MPHPLIDALRQAVSRLRNADSEYLTTGIDFDASGVRQAEVAYADALRALEQSLQPTLTQQFAQLQHAASKRGLWAHSDTRAAAYEALARAIAGLPLDDLAGEMQLDPNA